MGKLTISMAIFNSYVSLPEGIQRVHLHHVSYNVITPRRSQLSPAPSEGPSSPLADRYLSHPGCGVRGPGQPRSQRAEKNGDFLGETD